MSKPRKTEVTSKRIATIAGRILALKTVHDWFAAEGAGLVLWSEIRALAASALTQAADRPKWPALPVKAAPSSASARAPLTHAPAVAKKAGKLKRGPGAKPLGKFKRRVDLRARPKKERK